MRPNNACNNCDFDAPILLLDKLQRNSQVQLQPATSVHLIGSCIVSRAHMALLRTRMEQRWSGVLVRVRIFNTPAARQPNGAFPAGYIRTTDTEIETISQASHSLKSLEDAKHQVRSLGLS